MVENEYLFSLLFVLIAASLGACFSRKLKISPVLGYLLSGFVFANLIRPLFTPDDTVINFFAQLGVALLLFTIGLEFSLQRIRNLGDVVVLGSLVQILLTMLISLVLFPLLGFDYFTAFFLGSAFSLSSTAIVLKVLSDRGEMETQHGLITSGWLFMQDIYTIPIIVIIPSLGLMTIGGQAGLLTFANLATSIISAVLIFVGILITGRFIVPFVFDKIASLKIREALVITSVTACVLLAFIFEKFGLSFALGAFVAGILLSSSTSKYGIFSEIRPLKDLFSSVFFVSLGFIFKPEFILNNPLNIILIIIFVLVGKSILSGLLVFFSGFHSRTAFFTGMSLFSVGELAFVLGIIGLSIKVIDMAVFNIIVTVAFISLILSTPVIFMKNSLYLGVSKKIKKSFPRLVNIIADRLGRDSKQLSEIPERHVLVMGYGRVGKYVSRALELSGIPYIVIDFNIFLVKKLNAEGVKAIYGDPVEIDILHFAGIQKAKCAIIAFPDFFSQEMSLVNVLTLNPTIKVYVRTHFEASRNELLGLGATNVVQPEFEASVNIARLCMGLFGIPGEEIDAKIKRLKIEHHSIT